MWHQQLLCGSRPDLIGAFSLTECQFVFLGLRSVEWLIWGWSGKASHTWKKTVPFRTCRLNIALYVTFNFTISTDVIREMRIKLCVDISSFTVGTGKLKEPSFFFFFSSGGHLLFTCTMFLSSFPATAVSGSTCFLKLWITSVTQSQFGEEKKKKAELSVYKESRLVGNLNYSWNFWQTPTKVLFTPSFSKNMLKQKYAQWIVSYIKAIKHCFMKDA